MKLKKSLMILRKDILLGLNCSADILWKRIPTPSMRPKSTPPTIADPIIAAVPSGIGQHHINYKNIEKDPTYFSQREWLQLQPLKLCYSMDLPFFLD